MFLQSLRSKACLCDHPDDCFTVQDRVLKCSECDFNLSLPHLFVHRISETASLDYAEAYVRWSGDRSIPCKIYLHYFDRLFTVNFLRTTFETVEIATRLLRILHEPLKKGTPQPSPEEVAFFRETVSSELKAALDRTSNEDLADRNIRAIVRVGLALLLQHFESVRYFDVVVPHLKKIHRRDPCYDVLDDEKYPSVANSYDNRIMEASSIHRQMTRKSAAFEAVQIAVLCCLCRDAPGVVYDLVLDFAGRFCRGYHDDAFSIPSLLDASLLPNVKQILDSPESNTKIHRFLERLRVGGKELADEFSDEFFKTYWQLKSMLEDTTIFDFDYLYPRLFFRNSADYHAFCVALSHYAKETDVASKNINEILVGIVAPPGVITRCKKIYRSVKKLCARAKTLHECFVEAKLQEFYKSPTTCDDTLHLEDKRDMEMSYVWTRSMWKLYMHKEGSIATAVEWILTKLPLFSKNDPDFKAL